jgi:DMSO/TMAO reductase YedYZ molybdopterin-dependent catalytic subunit
MDDINDRNNNVPSENKSSGEGRKKINATVILLLIIVSLAGFLAYNLLSHRSAAPEVVKNLAASEVREYEGKDLSSIQDFRENSIKGPQTVDRNAYQLKIKGLSDGEHDYPYADIINNHQNYKKAVTLNCVEGWSVTILWEGILVKDLVERTKIPPGTNTVIFRAYDGYSTSFPLSYILDKDILMAAKINGVELPPERGFPFQLVAEDKWGYKWIKWITEIEFSADQNYKGYWEQRGYSNDGSLEKSIRE